MSGGTLGDLQLTWYNYIDPDETVKLSTPCGSGRTRAKLCSMTSIPKRRRPPTRPRRIRGCSFSKASPGQNLPCAMREAVFAYVGAMQDSFPHALELSKQGYNAFALIYRPGAETACEDLARAISFIFDHADELEVDTDCYSLWGGSAGARMAAWLGSYGPAAFGGNELPRPGAVIMQYTGLSDYAENDPPTFACVGERDGIANWRTMQRRLEAMSRLGIPTEFHHYPRSAPRLWPGKRHCGRRMDLPGNFILGSTDVNISFN